MTDLKTILDDLATLPGWEERYEYVIELGRQLPAFPQEQMTEANLVRGCTSTVYMTLSEQDGKLALQLVSDALIVQGLLAIVFAAYNGRSKAEAAAVDLPTLLAPTGLLEHLSPNRRHGFASVVARVRSLV